MESTASVPTSPCDFTMEGLTQLNKTFHGEDESNSDQKNQSPDLFLVCLFPLSELFDDECEKVVQTIKKVLWILPEWLFRRRSINHWIRNVFVFFGHQWVGQRTAPSNTKLCTLIWCKCQSQEGAWRRGKTNQMFRSLWFCSFVFPILCCILKLVFVSFSVF